MPYLHMDLHTVALRKVLHVHFACMATSESVYFWLWPGTEIGFTCAPCLHGCRLSSQQLCYPVQGMAHQLSLLNYSKCQIPHCCNSCCLACLQAEELQAELQQQQPQLRHARERKSMHKLQAQVRMRVCYSSMPAFMKRCEAR